MKFLFSVLTICLLSIQSWANLIYHPISFTIQTEKESYYEGEKINFIVTISNTSKEYSFPVLLPHTQNVGQKLFYFNAYDKANNTLLLRYTENKWLNMMVHDTGSVKIKYLKPQEQISFSIYLNDFENYYNYHTQNASHHSFGVPLFAGIYKMQLTYNPFGIPLGDSIYNYYNEFEKLHADNKDKLAMPTTGQISNWCTLKIKRAADSVVSIERKTYYVKKQGDLYFYLNKNLPVINSGIDCDHITNLPPDSCSMDNEYFYNHFIDLFAEFIVRFKDFDIREYRKFKDDCPEELYTEKYNDLKKRYYYALQLPNQMFYSANYHQPGAKIMQERYCSADGTLCDVISYIYNKKGKLIRKEKTQTEPCIVVVSEGKKKSLRSVKLLEAK
jgi:hypothetical protein